MKNILLNIIIFILVTSGTAVCVICANMDSSGTSIPKNSITQTNTDKNSDKSLPVDEDSDEPDPLSEAMFGLLQNIMSADSFSGQYTLKSSDGKTSVSGDIEAKNSNPSSTIEGFDIASLSLSLHLKGKVEGVNIDSTIIFKNNKIFLTVGNVKLSSTLDELSEVFAIISETFALPNLESVFDLENLNESLETATLKEYANTKIFSIKLPLIGSLSVTMNENHNPSNIKLSDLSFGGKKFECLISLSRNTDNSIKVENESAYIPLGKANDLIATLAKTYSSLPTAYAGTFTAPDFSGTIKISIAKNGTIDVSIGMNNFSLYLYINNNNTYLYCMGLKVFDTTENIFNFVYNSLGIDIVNMIKVQSITDGNVTIDDNSSLVYEKSTTGTLKSLYASFKGFNLQLSETKYVGIGSPPNTSGALSINDIDLLLKNIGKFLSKDSSNISFDIDAYLGTFSFSGRGYAKISNLSLEKMFISGKFAGKTLKAYSMDNNLYLDFDSLKVMMEKSDTKNFAEMIKKYLGFEGFTISDLFSLISTNISGITATNSTDILITFSSGVQIRLSYFDSKLYIDATNFAVAGKNLNMFLTLNQDGEKNKNIGDDFDASTFSHVGDASGFTQSLINTLTSKQTTFEGEIEVSLWFITIKKLSLKIETFYDKGKFKIEVTIDKLPTLALITTLNCIKYKNQYVKIVIEDGKVNISRYARLRFKDSEELKYQKSIAMKDFSLDVLMDTFGFDNTIKKRLKDASLPSSVGALFGEQALSFVDSSLAANIKASEIHKKLSNTTLEVKHSEGFVNNIKFTMDYGKLIHIKANLDKK